MFWFQYWLYKITSEIYQGSYSYLKVVIIWLSVLNTMQFFYNSCFGLHFKYTVKTRVSFRHLLRHRNSIIFCLRVKTTLISVKTTLLGVKRTFRPFTLKNIKKTLKVSFPTLDKINGVSFSHLNRHF
jgi:hypothetical protein